MELTTEVNSPDDVISVYIGMLKELQTNIATLTDTVNELNKLLLRKDREIKSLKEKLRAKPIERVNYGSPWDDGMDLF
jgi:hypothetical protein